MISPYDNWVPGVGLPRHSSDLTETTVVCLKKLAILTVMCMTRDTVGYIWVSVLPGVDEERKY